ncbi:hypothetical protein OF83DRAFT_753385 [Amylostereum chailletii]|nr:hypothetical protein OF83DRAFT_753385 [Amylostereum chailletii]
MTNNDTSNLYQSAIAGTEQYRCGSSQGRPVGNTTLAPDDWDHIEAMSRRHARLGALSISSTSASDLFLLSALLLPSVPHGRFCSGPPHDSRSQSRRTPSCSENPRAIPPPSDHHSLTIPELLDWQAEHNPDHPLFVYQDDQGQVRSIRSSSI